MSEAQLPANLASGLTQAECELVYNLEILQLPLKKAASLANVSFAAANYPHVMQARETVRRELRGNLPTREDLAHRMLEAVDRARILSEPMTEIIGLEKVAKLLGLDAPQKIDVNVTHSIEVLRENVRTLPTQALIQAVPGAKDIIDADFYEVDQA